MMSALVYTAKAQLGYNYAQYSMGFGLNYVKATTDVPSQTSHPAYNFNINYNFTPFTIFSLEYEFGRLSGGYGDYYDNASKGVTDPTKLADIYTAYGKIDPYYRYYYNNYQSINLHADVQLGEFIDYSDGGLITNIAKNIYVGTGIGMVYNNIAAINRISPDSTYSYGGSDHSNNVFIPVRIGYQLKLYNDYDEPSILVDLGYQMNYVFGYGLDGYSDPIFTTRNYETYGGFHIGVKFNFGSVTSYSKAIH
jgi:hypothetical protein